MSVNSASNLFAPHSIHPPAKVLAPALPEGMQRGRGRHLLLWERAQQKATMVAINTRNATPAPTATPMITAIGTDSARGRRGSMKPG